MKHHLLWSKERATSRSLRPPCGASSTSPVCRNPARGGWGSLSGSLSSLWLWKFCRKFYYIITCQEISNLQSLLISVQTHHLWTRSLCGIFLAKLLNMLPPLFEPLEYDLCWPVGPHDVEAVDSLRDPDHGGVGDRGQAREDAGGQLQGRGGDPEESLEHHRGNEDHT